MSALYAKGSARTVEDIGAMRGDLVRYLIRACGAPEQDALEAVDSVALDMVRRGGAPNYSYVRTAVRRAYFAGLRKLEREETTLDIPDRDDDYGRFRIAAQDAAYGAAALGAASDTDAIVARLDARASLALVSLPERQLRAMTLFYVDGFSWEEVGDLMSATPEAARALAKRGIAAARAQIAAGVPTEPAPTAAPRQPMSRSEIGRLGARAHWAEHNANKRHARTLATARTRHAERMSGDPRYRELKRENSLNYVRLRRSDPSYLERRRAERRARYQSDPEYRARLVADARARRAAKREEQA